LNTSSRRHRDGDSRHLHQNDGKQSQEGSGFHFNKTAKKRMVTMTQPTHEQGQLQLQLYDLRREAKLRQARDWFFQNYHVNTFDDAMRVAAPGTENGALAMMVFTYWDQACSFLNHGLLHEDLFFETSGEFFGVWELVKGIVPQGRERFANRLFLANLEAAARRYESWMESRSPGAIAAMRQMMKQMREQRAVAAKA
jgi:hypothetical protein